MTFAIALQAVNPLLPESPCPLFPPPSVSVCWRKCSGSSARVKDFSGDPVLLRQLGDAARTESARLARYADEDIAVFNDYMACRRLAKDTPQRDCALAAALRTTIEVPMNVARSAAAGIDLCLSAAGFVHAFVAADLGAAAELLAGAVRATLLSVDFNLSQIPHDSQYYLDVLAERHNLQRHALLKTDALLQRLSNAP